MPAPSQTPSVNGTSAHENGGGDHYYCPNMPDYLYKGEVCISGMSGRMPESANIEEFKEHLMKNEDMATADDRRWPVGIHGIPPRNGKLNDLDKFDAGFFGVHAKQADNLDPQLKMLLECSYEAIIDAGETMESVRGSRTGVFVGASVSECNEVWSSNADTMVGYSLPGCSRNMFSNRISFFFDFKGPSYTVDTACSSSAMCLNQALQNIRMGIIDAALVGGANLVLKAMQSLQFQRMGMLAPDGACKTFDASGNGYCRSESVMAIYLQKAKDCKRVYATLVHSKTNSDGYKEQGITFPAGTMQKRLIREVYHECGISPNDISYIEAHGTGTKVGDPQELNSLSEVFCEGRKDPLLIGSIKSNMGHSESCSALNAIGKVLIAMENEMIPANLHFKSPNPEIAALVDGRFKVVAENTRWKGGLAALNSFGYGGSNVHYVLRSNNKELKEAHPASQKVRLFTYCGHTEAGVREVLAEAKKNAHSVEFQSLIQPSANTALNLLPYRGYTVLNGTPDAEGVEKNSPEPRPVWFVFAGMGTQWFGMGRKMMELESFCNSINKCSKYLSEYNVDLYDLIMNGHEKTFDETIPSFVGITSIQVALVDLLFSMGIKPDGIVGHSLGELGCGYADGSLTAQEAVLASYWRGRCITEATLPPGKMAAVGLSWEECKRLCPEGVVPACHNSVDTVTISGPYETTTKFVEELKAQGIFTRDVKSGNVAFHSYFMKAVAPQLKAALQKVIVPKKRSPKWVSTSVPEDRWHEELAQYSSADYHVNNFVNAVLFQEGLQKIPSNAIAIEISPHSLFQAVLKRSLSTETVILGCMKRFHENNLQFFFEAAGKLYANGVNLDPLSMFPPVEFPVPRGTPMISSCISKIWDHSISWKVPTHEDFPMSGVGGASTDSNFDIDISEDSADNYLVGHKIDGRVLFPATGYLVLAWKALARIKGQLIGSMPVIFQNVHIQRATMLPPTGKVNLSVSVMQSSGEFEVCENGSLSASGIVMVPEGEFMDGDKYPSIQAMRDRKMTTEFHLTREEVYKELRLRGYEYGPTFQGIHKAEGHGGNVELVWDGRWIPFMDTMLQMQLLSNHEQVLRLPTRIKSVKIDPRAHPPAPAENEFQTLPAYADDVLGMCVSGGVEIQGMETAIAPRRAVHNSPILEEYRFVPYQDNSSADTVDPTLKDYCTACLGYALDSLQSLVAKDENNFLPNKDLLNKVINNHKSSKNVDLSKFSNLQNSSLVKALQEVFSVSLTENFQQNAQNMISSLHSQLASDPLLACLAKPSILKPAIDLMLENTKSRKISIFEVDACQSSLYSKIVPFFESQTLTKLQYTACDKSPPNKDCKNFNVKASQWDMSTASAPPPGQSDMVVLKNVLHKQNNLDKTMELVSSMVSKNGFLLVEEVTRNFPLYLVLDAFKCKLDLSSNDNKGRECGFYLSEASWEKVFAKHGYEVVYKKSDQLLSTLFLLKRKVTLEEKPTLFSIDDLECSWVEDLKAQMKLLESSPSDARLWLTARGQNNGVMGFVNCLRSEPGSEKVRVAFISNLDSASKTPDLSLNNEEFKALVQKDLVINVYRDGQWGSFKHLPISSDQSLQKKSCSHAYVNVLTRGDLSSLRWIESPLKYFHAAKSHKELLSVYYTSLNFRDIMLASGKLPPDALQPDVAVQDCILGMEVAGRNTKGQRVMGLLACKGLATSVDVDPEFMWEIPDHWSMEQAATVPVVYSTVYYALVIRGNIRKGERVLIHSGSGGVGQAAISVALSYGCEVFTTVGSQEKKEFLKKAFPQLKDRNFSSSRDLSFEFDILRETNGKGVDIVLNSLAEEKLQSSVRLLARHGRFLEIGKFDLSKNSSLGMSIFLRNISFHGVLLDALFDESGVQNWKEVAQKVREGIASGVVRPLNATVFDKDDLEQAFRYMAQGKHIGKVVVKVREEEARKAMPASSLSVPAIARTACHPSKTYIITGGLGGFGLELANWLVDRGAKKLVLTSRSGIKTGYQNRKVKLWRSEGIEVKVSKHSCTSEAGTKALLEEAASLGPVGGVFNLAMVLRDTLFEDQTKALYDEVTDPKVKGTVNLDKMTRKICADSLDWFVVFSSISSGRGNVGQTNYGFANSVMERICEKRRADKLHGLAIQWGAIGDVGFVAESMGGNETVIGGTLPQRMILCMSVLDDFLNQSCPVVESFVPAQMEKRKEGAGSQKANLVEAVARILGVKDANTIDGEASLGELGLDSLMGVEIKQLLERDHDISLSTKEIRMLNINRLHAINEAEENSDENDGKSGDNESGLTSSALKRFDCEQVLPKQTIVHLNDVKNGLKPLFVVHPIEGNIESLRGLAASLPCPVYGLQLTSQAPLTSLGALAGFYLQNIYTIDSQGPYRLAGYSLGTVIALEMATQLQKHYPNRPDIVESLILLDGSHCLLDIYTNAYRRALKPNSKAEVQAATMVGFLKQFIKLEDELAVYQNILQFDSHQQQIEAGVDYLMKANSFPSRDDLHKLAQAFFSLIQMAENYVPAKFIGDITLVKAKQNAVSSAMITSGQLGVDYNLHKVCDGKVHVVEVEGDHENFLIEDGAPRVANIMVPVLN